MALFLVWHDEDKAIPPDLGVASERFELCPGLTLVDSPLDLSPLYHQVKWSLPSESALLVAPLAEVPKFKLMGRGALNWIRARRRAAEAEEGRDD